MLLKDHPSLASLEISKLPIALALNEQEPSSFQKSLSEQVHKRFGPQQMSSLEMLFKSEQPQQTPPNFTSKSVLLQVNQLQSEVCLAMMP